MDFNKDIPTNKINICIKKFSNKYNNYTDIVIIYNDKVGNDKINKQILNKTRLFDLKWREDLKMGIYDSKLKIRKLKLNDILRKLKKININDN